MAHPQCKLRAKSEAPKYSLRQCYLMGNHLTAACIYPGVIIYLIDMLRLPEVFSLSFLTLYGWEAHSLKIEIQIMDWYCINRSLEQILNTDCKTKGKGAHKKTHFSQQIKHYLG